MLSRVIDIADRWVGRVVAAVQWLALPLAALLLLQWPLREMVQRFSREANDLGQVVFALYVSMALTAALRAGTHLHTDVLAHRYPARVQRALAVSGLVLAIVPWCCYVLATHGATAVRSIALLEAFPDTFNPGYFVVKLAPLLMAALLLLQSLSALARLLAREASS